MGNGNRTIGYGCFAVNLLILLVLALVVGFLGYLIGVGWLYVERGPGVAVLEVRSAIYDETPVLDQLDQLLKNPDTCALVIHVDSPGGVISAVEEIYNALNRAAADRGIPVVASMGALATSGGYFVCLPAERIFANRTSVTGSIGVLVEYYSLGGLLDKIGVQSQTVTSGEYKGLGSWAQPLTDAQRQHMQDIVNDFHNFFVEIVSTERHVELARVREWADGRVFTGRQALEMGMVDELGGLNDAIAFAGERAHLEGEPRVIRASERTVSLVQMVRRYGPPPWGAAAGGPAVPAPGLARFWMR